MDTLLSQSEQDNYGHGLVLRPNSHAFCQPTRSWITLTSRQASSSTQHEETQFDPMEHISQEMTRYLSSGGGSSGEAALSEAMSLSFAGITFLPLPSNGPARIPDRWKPVFKRDENGKGFWDRTDAETGEDNAEAKEIDGVEAMITWVDEKDLIRSADDMTIMTRHSAAHDPKLMKDRKASEGSGESSRRGSQESGFTLNQPDSRRSSIPTSYAPSSTDSRVSQSPEFGTGPTETGSSGEEGVAPGGGQFRDDGMGWARRRDSPLRRFREETAPE